MTVDEFKKTNAYLEITALGIAASAIDKTFESLLEMFSIDQDGHKIIETFVLKNLFEAEKEKFRDLYNVLEKQLISKDRANDNEHSN